MAKKSRVRRRKSIKRKSRVRRGRKIIKGGAGGYFFADITDGTFLPTKFRSLLNEVTGTTVYTPSSKINVSFKIIDNNMISEDIIVGKVVEGQTTTPGAQYNIKRITQMPKGNFIVYYDDYEPLGSVDSD
jgi:hypothetical protein